MKTKITNTINWFKKLIYVINNYDKDLHNTMRKIRKNELEIVEGVKLIKDRTTLHVDVHSKMNSPTQVILIGRYNNRDYVNVFALHDDDIHGLIHQLKDMEKYAELEHIDAPIELKSIIEHDLNW